LQNYNDVDFGRPWTCVLSFRWGGNFAAFLRTVFFGRSRVMKQAASDLRRHIDYLVWAISILVACGIVYSTMI
jgi:hypothetical protein